MSACAATVWPPGHVLHLPLSPPPPPPLPLVCVPLPMLLLLVPLPPPLPWRMLEACLPAPSALPGSSGLLGLAPGDDLEDTGAGGAGGRRAGGGAHLLAGDPLAPGPAAGMDLGPLRPAP